MFVSVLEDYRAVSGVFQLDKFGSLTPHRNTFLDNRHRFPLTVIAILVGVLRVHFIDQ
jgi:hypothetical protein